MSALLDTGQIAKLLGLKRPYVTDKLTKRPDFPKPVVNASSRLRRWREADVALYMSNGRHETIGASDAPTQENKKTPPPKTVRDCIVSTYRNAKRRGRREGMEFTMTEASVLAMLERQGMRCAVSGMPFTTERAFAPSLDRRDNAKGYTEDNVRLVCCCINFMMNTWGDAVFVKLRRHIEGA